MIPFSPTRTADFLRCPLYAQLKRTWAPRGQLWTPNILLGTAIGDALNEHYRGKDRPAPEDTLRRVILEGWQPNDKWTQEALIKLAQRGYERAAEDALRDAGEVLMVDEPLPSTGRPDLVQRVSGELVVTDTKVTLAGGTDRLSEYLTSHQLFHYAWEVGEVLQERVAWCRIHYVMLTPRVETFLHPVEIQPWRLARWLESVKPVWERMAAGDTSAHYTGCHTRYGPCEFLPACHVLNLDPDAMEATYERVPART